MYKKNFLHFLKRLFTIQLIFASIIFAQNGSLRGTITDAVTKDPLPGANIILLGTSIGAASDGEGKFLIRNIPVGNYKVKATYVGYDARQIDVDIKEGLSLEVNFELKSVSVEGQTVVVTAQASGQNEAINQQLSSIQVKNVVSMARIQELPDANAAESVSRLPGVSLIRTGGEGSKVVIRGLSPQYNQITIDGVELPSDVGSANNLLSGDKGQAVGQLGDRGTDLSMISSSMLGGIEVIKAITPDMDATLIGGVVNFGLRKATKSTDNRALKNSSLPLISITSQGSYNDLKNTYNDYKFVGSLEKRFFDESFGVFVQASTEKRNLSANELGVTYVLNDKTHGDEGIPDLSSLDLTDIFRKRERTGVTAVLDYEHKHGEIGLMNFFSRSDTRTTRRGESIVPIPNDLWYTVNDQHNTLDVMSNLLIVKQEIPFFHVDLKLSHSKTESENPEDLFFNFWQDNAGLSNSGDLTKVHPKKLASLVVPDDSTGDLDQIQTSGSIVKETVYQGSLDLSSNFNISSYISAILKFGGMFQSRDRSYDFQQSRGSQLYSGGGNVLAAFTKAYPDLFFNSSGRLGLLNFLNPSYSYGNFLNGDYSLAYPVSPDLMWKLLPIAKKTSSLEGYQLNKLASAINDYSGNEFKSAAYIMATINLGDKIMLIPGVRYQNLTTEFTAMRGETTPNGLQGNDTTVTQSHGFVLPMVHVRYKPFEWLQLQFAYTNTLNYPDYSAITPKYYVGTGFIQYNNFRLKPATSENYDLVLSIYANEIGLLTVDGFKKRIKNLIFGSQTYKSDLSEYPELPQNKKSLYQFNTYINNPIPIDVYGVETEWQTHFWYLPGVLSGMIFNINYTHIFSEASYPRSEVTTIYNEDGTFTQAINDTFYTTRLLNQPNDILNLSIGYDYEGFSARLSMLYQDNIFKRPDFWMQLRTNSAKYTRWDLSVRQKLPWYGIQVYFNLNNLTGEDDVDVNRKTSFPASEQRYGMTGDIGLRITL